MSRANNQATLEALNESLLNVLVNATEDGLKRKILEVKKIVNVAKFIVEQMKKTLGDLRVTEPRVKKAEPPDLMELESVDLRARKTETPEVPPLLPG